MYYANPDMFVGGPSALPPGDSRLIVAEFDKFHVGACKRRGPAGALLRSCYWFKLRLCIVNGWCPPVDVKSIYPLYKATRPDGNHRSASTYSTTIKKEIAKQLSLGICTAFPNAPPEAIIGLLGAVLKGSSKSNAKVNANIDLLDEDSLSLANI
jgi:hypothetical protein